jgi:hypothetical protein
MGGLSEKTSISNIQVIEVPVITCFSFQSKLKDGMSDLATILEHETMDFTSSPPTLSIQLDTPGVTATTGNAADDVPMKLQQPLETSDSLWENLHSLPL